MADKLLDPRFAFLLGMTVALGFAATLAANVAVQLTEASPCFAGVHYGF